MVSYRHFLPPQRKPASSSLPFLPSYRIHLYHLSLALKYHEGLGFKTRTGNYFDIVTSSWDKAGISQPRGFSRRRTKTVPPPPSISGGFTAAQPGLPARAHAQQEQKQGSEQDRAPFPAPPVTPRRFPAGAGAPQPPAPRKRATSGMRSCDVQPGHGCSTPAPAGRRRDLRSGAKKPNPAPGERRRRSLFPVLRTQTPRVTHRLWPQGSEAEPGRHTGVWASPGNASHGLKPARKPLRCDPAPLHPAKPGTKLAAATRGSRREPAPGRAAPRGLQERGRGVPPSHARDAGVGELPAPSPSAFPCHKAPGTPASRRFA